MKTIDNISYAVFKKKMLEVQQALLKRDTAHNGNPLGRAGKYFSRKKIKTPDNNHPLR